MIKWMPAGIMGLLWLGGLLTVRPWRTVRSRGQALAVLALWGYLAVLIPLCFTPFPAHRGVWAAWRQSWSGPHRPTPFPSAAG